MRFREEAKGGKGKWVGQGMLEGDERKSEKGQSKLGMGRGEK